MQKRPNWTNSLDWCLAIFTLLGGVAVLHTFVLGKHYIIPTVLLFVTVILGNLAWYGLSQHKWAKRINFWCGVLLTSHGFFALFWSKKYRDLLGAQFEWVCILITLVFLMLTVMYAKRNHLSA